MAFCTTDDNLQLFYTVHSEGEETIVFSHGWVNDSTVWKLELDYFASKGYRVISYDLRGHGKSQVAKAEHYGIEHFTADLKKVIDVTNTKNPILVGHSMGGLISLAYQSRYHDAQKIILCATTAALIVPKRLPKWGEGFVDYVLQKTIENKSFMEKKLPDTFTSYAKKFYEEASPFFEGLQTVNLGTVLSCLNMMLKTDMLHNLDKITVPILVIEGKKDRLLPSLKEIDNLKNVSGEKIIITLEGTHFINREQPEKVAELIFNFLNDAK